MDDYMQGFRSGYDQATALWKVIVFAACIISFGAGAAVVLLFWR